MHSGNHKTLLYAGLIINVALAGVVCASRSGSISIPFQEEDLAQNPIPADNETAWQASSVVLRWTPSPLASLQKLYLGTTSVLTAQDWVADKSSTADSHFYIPGFRLGTMYYWRIDTVDFLGTVHTGHVWQFSTVSDKASAPDPANGALGVDPDIPALTWQAGLNASEHRVYFGTTVSAVANGAAYASEIGEGRVQHPLAEPLSTDTTYYWRVDEERDDGTVITGNVWQFTTRWADGGMLGTYFNNTTLSDTPQITRIDDTIDFTFSNNWLGGNFSVRWTGYLAVTTSGRYEFTVLADDKVRLWLDHELKIDDWTAQSVRRLTVTDDLAAGGTYPITLEYANVPGGSAQIQALWSGPDVQQEILSGSVLRPVYQADQAVPANGETQVRHQPVLQWQSGCKANYHRVYFGTDFFTVANATVPQSTVNSRLEFRPSKLAWNQTYYWRVDEVNDWNPSKLWTGEVWSFTTADYYVLDDFETYADSTNHIYETWLDGLGFGEGAQPGNGTGATVGHLQEPYAEQRIVSHGEQSMPFYYNNTGDTGKTFYSEIERTLWSPVDFTSQDGRLLRQLRLDFHGLPTSLGQFIQNGSTYALTGGGSGIGSQEDHCYFVYSNAVGNCTLAARVNLLQTSGLSAQAGLMLRANLAADAPQIAVTLKSDGRLVAYTRTAAGQVASMMVTDTPVGFPHWLRLSRQGNTVSLEHSTNGVSWQTVYQATFILPNSAYLGLAVAGQGDDYTLVQADFSQVSGTHTPLQTDQDMGMVLNSPSDLYVVIQDTSNNEVVIPHSNNPNAVLQEFWDTWFIPLGTVSGVDLTQVKKLIIGVGNRNNPQPAGKGLVYIDDIGLTE